MSKQYRRAIGTIATLTEAQSTKVCIELAQTNPTAFNRACVKLGIGARAMELKARSFLRDGTSIEAVKFVRSVTDFDQQQAQSYVDSLGPGRYTK